MIFQRLVYNRFIVFSSAFLTCYNKKKEKKKKEKRKKLYQGIQVFYVFAVAIRSGLHELEFLTQMVVSCRTEPRLEVRRGDSAASYVQWFRFLSLLHYY